MASGGARWHCSDQKTDTAQPVFVRTPSSAALITGTRSPSAAGCASPLKVTATVAALRRTPWSVATRRRSRATRPNPSSTDPRSMLDARCSMLDARCSMLDARCSLLDARCSMLDKSINRAADLSRGGRAEIRNPKSEIRNLGEGWADRVSSIKIRGTSTTPSSPTRHRSR